MIKWIPSYFSTFTIFFIPDCTLRMCFKIIAPNSLTYTILIGQEQCSSSVTLVQFKYNTSAKSVTQVQITTKISEVSPKKPGERWRLPKVIWGVPKITEVNPKTSEDYQRVPKITQRLPKVSENDPNISEEHLKTFWTFLNIIGDWLKIFSCILLSNHMFFSFSLWD